LGGERKTNSKFIGEIMTDIAMALLEENKRLKDKIDELQMDLAHHNHQSKEEKISKQVTELFTALAKAQGEIKPALKDKFNSFLKNKYASLDSIWNVCRKPLSDNGLSVTQWPMVRNEMLVMNQMLIHSSGQFIKYDPLVIKIEKLNAQGVGIAITYARRYMLSAALGITSDEDDDAQGISGDIPPDNQRKAPATEPNKKAISPPPWKPTFDEFLDKARENFPGLTDQDIKDELKEAKFSGFKSSEAVKMMAALEKRIEKRT
jgi:hypothetical protein